VSTVTMMSGMLPMTDEQECGLLRSFLCGFPDKVARRMTLEEAATLGVIPRHRKIAFTVCTSQEPVFLENNATVHLEGDNEYVCFAEMLELTRVKKGKAVIGDDDYDDFEDEDEDEVFEVGRNGDEDYVDNEDEEAKAKRVQKREEEATREQALKDEEEPVVEKRIVLRGVSIVQTKWLAVDAFGVCRLFKPKAVQLPRYDGKSDRTTRIMQAHYGSRLWPLGSLAVGTEQARNAMSGAAAVGLSDCGAFATGLLEGRVFSELKMFATCLVGDPLDTSRGGNVAGVSGKRVVMDLVSCLERRSVCTRTLLVQEWRNDPGYLQTEYLQWIRKGIQRTRAETGFLKLVASKVRAAMLAEQRDAAREAAVIARSRTKLIGNANGEDGEGEEGEEDE
jgi:hypothetical protein